MYNTIETEIYERLDPLKELGIQVRGLPNEPKNCSFQLGTEDLGLITFYFSEMMVELPTISQNNQFLDSEQMVEIILQFEIKLRKLRGTTGGLPIISLIEGLMLGFQSSQSFQFNSLGWTFEGLGTDKTYQFLMRFGVPRILVMDVETETLPLLKQMTFEYKLTTQNPEEPNALGTYKPGLILDSFLNYLPQGNVNIVKFDYRNLEFSTAILLKGNEIYKTVIRITTAFNGTTPTLKIGTVKSHNYYMADDETDLKTVGITEITKNWIFPDQSSLIAFLDASNSTTGEGLIYTYYNI